MKQWTGAEKVKIYKAAREKLGNPNVYSLGNVGRHVALRLKVQIPGTKADVYELLERYVYGPPDDPEVVRDEIIDDVPIKLPKRRKPRKPRAPRVPRSSVPATSDAFLVSYEWRKLRMVILTRYGATCMCCGATREDGLKIHVDHIKPRKRFPNLALDESNLQVLCEVCNHGKGNWDATDWRPKTPPVSDVKEKDVDYLDRLRPLWARPTIQ